MQLKLNDIWPRFWMRFSGLSRIGRIACGIAAVGAAPSYGRVPLSRFGRYGFISTSALIHHQKLSLSRRCFIGDGVTLYQDIEGEDIRLSEGVHIHRDTTLQTGRGGTIKIEAKTHIQLRCQVVAYAGPIHIGARGEIAPHCGFYSYDHGMSPELPVRKQPMKSRGGIVVGDDVWLGFGVIVLDGVHIGNNAVIGAGSVVTKDIPEASIAVGNPARVIKMR
jgi:acetyltransferase-like isoleucine patch superfamily enzyme